MSSPTLAQVVSLLDEAYPQAGAQSWDRVGLVTGDPAQTVGLVHFAVDPTHAVTQEAVRAGADLLVTHHPLLLRGVHSVATTTAKGAIVTGLIVGDVALYCAHTNADSATPGVNTALALACGLREDGVEPLSISEGSPLGLVGDLAEPVSLGDFAARLASRLPRTAGGVRVSGDASASVKRVALLGGAGDSLFDEVRAAEADVYVTSDLRHHPALEAREEARDGAPYLVDAGHFATEYLWLERAAAELRAALAAQGFEIETHVSEIVTDPWSFTVGTRELSPASGASTENV
ncbi:MAG: Nif3-like dinuclear metal center hexameric protein [Dermatophilus congolensis]|nr:Nif3-like dinuclear metal center hexameric protein [Dermatophilus congolensis]